MRPANRFPSDDPAVKGDSPGPTPVGQRQGERARPTGDEPAYSGIAASSPPPETGGGWASASSGPSAGPSWASDDPTTASGPVSGASASAETDAPADVQASGGPSTGGADAARTSRLAAARAAVAAEAPARTPDAYVADDSAASADDEDIAELGEVGRPVIERLLGGKVIDEGS